MYVGVFTPCGNNQDNELFEIKSRIMVANNGGYNFLFLYNNKIMVTMINPAYLNKKRLNNIQSKITEKQQKKLDGLFPKEILERLLNEKFNSNIA